MTELQHLLEEIAHCSIANGIRSGSHVANPCQKIVGLQDRTSIFQIPEPWSGQIDLAPILFISSNPSLDESKSEEYPDESWELELITDFFQNRFTSLKVWVNSKLRPLRRNGDRAPYVRFWAAARSRTSEILGKDKNEIAPRKDFALTEIVHCKSRNEIGVKEAVDFCSQLYLERILSISAAKILIVYGAHAEMIIRKQFGTGMAKLEDNINKLSLKDRSAILIFLPHPNERGSKKSLRANAGEPGLALIRTFLA